MPFYPGMLLIIIVALFQACTFSQKHVTITTPSPDAKTLLRIIDIQNSAVSSLEGRMSSKIENAEGKSSSTQLILIKKPAYLRLDALTPFGQPALTVATDGDMIFLYHHTKRRYFAGMAKSHHLSNILPPSLSMTDLALILSGGIPMIDFDHSRSTVESRDDRYLLTLRKGRLKEEVLFHETTLEPREVIIYDQEDKVILSVFLDGFKTFETMRRPTKIKTILPEENYTLEVTYSDMTINNIEGTGFFELEPPEGISVENLNSHMF